MSNACADIVDLSLNRDVLVAELLPFFEGPPGPAGSSQSPHQDTFTPTNGQTSFVLSAVPAALSVRCIVNAAALLNGTDFTVAGAVVTFLAGLSYTLSSSDVVQFFYTV